VVSDGPPDASIRPNQIFAVSLPYTMLSPDRSRSVVEKVREHLLTPYGLRTLAPSDPQYRGRYTGGRLNATAHTTRNGLAVVDRTIISAYLKVNGTSDAAATGVEWLQPLKDHLSDADSGHISEFSMAMRLSVRPGAWPRHGA